MTVIYPEFRDFCEIAGATLGTTPEQIERLPNVSLAASAIAAPSAGFGETDAYPTLLEKAAVLLEHPRAKPPAAGRQQAQRVPADSALPRSE